MPPTGDIKSKIQLNISQNKIMVFSKSSCPYCIKVKKLFKSLGADYYSLELDQIPDGSAIQSALAEITGQSTVPNVFINGQHIGGCDATHQLHSENRLLPLING